MSAEHTVEHPCSEMPLGVPAMARLPASSEWNGACYPSVVQRPLVEPVGRGRFI